MSNLYAPGNGSESPNPSPVPTVLQRGDLTIDFGQHIITIAGKNLDLSATEFGLLAHLVRVFPEIVTPQALAAQVQGYEGQSLQEANSTLRYHFYRLRRKIKQQTGRDDLIKTIHGVGYALYQRPASDLPSGGVTFFFTDIQDSTSLWDEYPNEMQTALARHDTVVRKTIETYGGYIFKRAGDMFCAAFTSPSDALSAALATQRALHSEVWATPVPLRVRIALNTGPAELRDGDYYGITLNLLGRLIGIGHGGQILLTGTTQEQVARRLPVGIELRDLGPRRLKGIKKLTRVFQVVVSDLPAQFPALKSADMRPSNLPAPLTSFVGREWDTRQVTTLLRRQDVRLLTLTGVGGAGKTRLALHVAATLQDEYEDGVLFVPLATVRDAERVAPAIARALGLEENGAAPLMERLQAHLRERQVLLLIDNMEQVLDAAPVITELLSAAPQVRVLATSREALQLYGEQLYPVAPLRAPDTREPIHLAQVERYEATRLFMDRARAAYPHWTVTEEDAPVIAGICVCLDGLPLAIELAAARVTEFSLRDLATQLISRLGFLSTGPRDLPARHRTLRGLLDWSYHLLTASEQAAFARLAVFVGGWTPAAARAVAIWDGDEAQVDERALEALSRKFLIQETDGAADTTRLTMLGTIHEYALERLEASDDAEPIRARHANYYRDTLVQVEQELMGGTRQKSALWMCELEQDNFRAALDWALTHQQVELALQMVKALWRFWGISSQFIEGRRWVERTLDLSSDANTAPDADPALRAAALYGLSKLAMFQGEYPVAQRAAGSALEIYRELGDEDGMGWCLNALGEIASRLRDAGGAETYFESSLDLHKRVNNKLGIAKALDDLGRLAMDRRDYTRAVALLEESLRLRRERGSTEGIAVGLLALGEVLRLQGDYPKAEMHTRESLARYRQLNHTAGVITCLYNLAQVREQQNDAGQAVALYIEGLGLLRDLEEEQDLALACLAGLAEALYDSGEFVKAAQVIGTYQAMLAETGAVSEISAERQDLVRRRLGDAAWTSATAQGRGMSIEDLLLALSKRKLGGWSTGQ